MFLAYRIFSNLIYPFLIIFIFFRKIIKKEDPKRYKEKIFVSNFNVKRKDNVKLIWFHAASVGEFKSILPIIENLNESYDAIEFLITTTTYSSSKLANTYLKNFDNVQHRFFPLDVDFLVKKFLQLWKPTRIFLVDSEIWPNLIMNSSNNARLTEKSFKRWSKLSNTAKKVFNQFDMCLSSSIETKNFLEKLNAKNIHFYGNIKLINKIDPISINSLNSKILENKKFWLAVSTHAGEEEFCLKVHSMLAKKIHNVVTIIAPRHIDRSSEIGSISKKFGYNTQILNKGDKIINKSEIIIINSFGVLPEYLKFAKSVFIGKSMIEKLKNDSGQNPIEAAKLNCKIYHGPYVYNFKEIYKILERNHISKKIDTHHELGECLLSDLMHPKNIKLKSAEIIESLGQKTLSDTMISINNFIFNDIKKT